MLRTYCVNGTEQHRLEFEEAQAIAKKNLPMVPEVPHPDCHLGWSRCFASALEMQELESQPLEENENDEASEDEYETEESDDDEEKIGLCEQEEISSWYDDSNGEKKPSNVESDSPRETQLTSTKLKSHADGESHDFTSSYDVKKRKINLRFAHYPTYEPILLELEVGPTITLKSLRDTVEETLIADEYCRMKMCTNWFTEVKTGDSRKRLALATTDTETVKSVGLDDESVIYLEGPLSGSIQSVDTAIAIVNSQGKRQAAQQNELLNFLVAEMKAMRESFHCRENLQMRRLEEERVESRKVIQQLSEEIRSLRSDRFLVSEMKTMRESQTHLLTVIGDQQKQIKMLMEQSTKLTKHVEALTAKVEQVKNTMPKQPNHTQVRSGVPVLPQVKAVPPRQQMTWNEFQHSVGGQGYTKKEISDLYWEYKASF